MREEEKKRLKSSVCKKYKKLQLEPDSQPEPDSVVRTRLCSQN
jgi:hypothetical protein